MSTPGWYPDPGGRPGHFRFWDGRGWASTTTTEIPGGPPTGPSTPGTPGWSPRRRRRLGLVAGIAAAVVLVLVVVGVLVLGPSGAPVAGPTAASSATQGTDPSTPGAAPSSEASGSDDPGSPGSPTPSAQPSTSCPVGDPLARQDHPNDGRVHGGGLSIPGHDGWADPGGQQTAFTWAYDVGETETQVGSERYAVYAVGALSVADGFEDPRSAAELSLRCTLGSALFRDVVGQPTVVERQTTVDGYPSFTVSANVQVRDDQAGTTGDIVVITVVDLGSPESLAFFWGSAPVGDVDLGARLSQVARSIQVD